MNKQIEINVENVGKFTMRELTLSDSIRVRGYRNRLCEGQWGEMSTSLSIDDQNAAGAAHILATLVVATDKFPEGIKSYDDLAAKCGEGAIPEFYGKYQEHFPDPFRHFYPTSDRDGKDAPKSKSETVPA